MGRRFASTAHREKLWFWSRVHSQKSLWYDSCMNFSTITDELFIGSMPSVNQYDQLRELGVQLIINMRFSLGPRPDSHQIPIHTLWLRSVDSPFFPIAISKLMRGAQAALETIHEGGKVYAHAPMDVTAAWRWARAFSSRRVLIRNLRCNSSKSAAWSPIRLHITSARAFSNLHASGASGQIIKFEFQPRDLISLN